MDTLEERIDAAASGDAPKLTDWENEPSVGDLEGDLAIAKPYHDEVVSKINNSLDAKNVEGKYKPKKIEGRSSIQPKLIRKQNEWRYPGLSEPFLSAEKLFTVNGVSFEDSANAKQNELLLNYQFSTKIDKVKFIDEYVRTLVDKGMCSIRVGWKRVTKMVTEVVPVWQYMAVEAEEELQMLQAAVQLKQSNPQDFEHLDESVKASVDYSMETGQPAIAIQIGEQEVEVEKVIENCPTVDFINEANLYLDPTALGKLSKANFAVLAFETSKAACEKAGVYSNLDAVDWNSNASIYTPDTQKSYDDTTQFKDLARKKVMAYEYWGEYDIYGTGELIPIVATWIGQTMIRMEENPYPHKKIPIVVVSYLPIVDAYHGDTDAELLIDNQSIQGALMRGMIDLMGRSANGQTGYAKQALDTVNRKRFEAGLDYEFNPNGGDPSKTFYQHKFPEIPQSALTMLQIQNADAESMTGVKSFDQGLNSASFGNVASGIKGMLSASGKREMSIVRRLCQGLEQVGKFIVSMNGVFLTEDEVVQVTNEQYVRIRPEDLEGEFNLKVDTAPEEQDNAKAQDIGMLLQTIGNNMPFDITKIWLAELARLKRMPAVEHAILNYSPPPNPVAEKMQELEIAEIEAKIAESMARAEEFKARAVRHQAEARKAASEADLKDLKFMEDETGTTHLRDLDKAQAQAQGNKELEITKALLAPKTKEGGITPQNINEAIGFNYMTKDTI